MNIRVHAPMHRILSHQIEWASAFVAGLQRHGIKAAVHEPSQFRPCDIVVVWGHRAASRFKQQTKNGGRYIVMERGYVLDRHAYTSLGFDGLNGRATFPQCQDGGERWRRLFGGTMEDHNPGGSYALIMGQVPGDAAVAHVNIAEWYTDAANAVRKLGVEPRFRQHPLAAKRGSAVTPKNLPEAGGTLAQDIAGARWVVTFNSNSGVDAVLAGKPVVAVDEGSMVWRIAGHDVAAEPVWQDRTKWAHQIAWCQWSKQEIASGEAWEALRTCL